MMPQAAMQVQTLRWSTSLQGTSVHREMISGAALACYLKVPCVMRRGLGS